MGERRSLRVLLISPVASLDPGSGDVTFTDELLASPPPGVSYVTYDEALRSGELIEVGTRPSLRDDRASRRLAAAIVALWRLGETQVRRSGLGYRERLRHFRVQEGRFDLVHVHVFHSKFVGSHPPIIMSAGSPLSWLYADAFGWEPRRIRMAELLDRSIGRVWGATMCGGKRGQAVRHVVATHYYKTWLAKTGRVPSHVVDVVPNYLSLAEPPLRATRKPLHFVVVAKDFAANGLDVLDAFARVQEKRPDATLTVVGSDPPGGSAPGVRWLGHVSRRQLLADVLPGLDVLVHPSRVDVLPYAPMEALALGMPVIVSDYRALPELAGDGAGLVVPLGDVPSLAAAMDSLLDPTTYGTASAAARRHFDECYAASGQATRLGDSYRRALARAPKQPQRSY